MNDVVMKEVVYIDERSYQQMKKMLGKSNDYFYVSEIKQYIASSK